MSFTTNLCDRPLSGWMSHMISNTVENAFSNDLSFKTEAVRSIRNPGVRRLAAGPALGLRRAPNQRGGVAQATWTGGESGRTDDPSSGWETWEPLSPNPEAPTEGCRRKTINFLWLAPIRPARSRPVCAPSTQDRRTVPVRRGHETDAHLTRRQGWRATSGGAPVPALDRERLSRLDVVEQIPANFPPALM